MGNEQSKQQIFRQEAVRGAKVAGNALLALAISPLLILCVPFAYVDENITGLGTAADLMVGVIAGVLMSPLIPIVLPIMIGVSEFNAIPSRRVVSQVCEEARRKLGMDCNGRYNIAIVGASGEGKSSLVNGLMGVDDSADNAIQVGEVETTSDIKSYCHPHLETVVLWDLPGGGTERHPGETYFKDKMLFAFDAVIIVTSTTFTQIDIDIAKRAASAKVPVFFVRNKSDQDITSKQCKKPKMTWEQAAMELHKKVTMNSPYHVSLDWLKILF
ncbi:interferon-inducible GTPase-domain-containing protein [Jimgerdemannia flammicorona]|uniref:Interferon-inducible GTPase-domain-containing protein n=1 Tax=Jimgerdemannia flammicorona TaxID=994334 RepID=A0A433Q468_9FUNG|nr:interferon-inducible GTPase-domain-containing protein [Jimgerdemannia flammicorona]